MGDKKQVNKTIITFKALRDGRRCSMSNIKELIKEKLNQLSKEELVDALADVCTIYVSANITTQLSSANCIQQCVNNIQTNIQEVDNIIKQKINANIK